ncbi:putative carboxy-muconate cyclase [Phaeomoniella chlamydospora]|uniref:Putative carboxy-muconate cyclase n=1 Tax=Phaeomoniella chlamydospora TaxID=158046 RepID=A0A0G2ETS4_PHACM|nr:putative carboxy-muconate cyclase [Phaeomoniella chlamydospora]
MPTFHSLVGTFNTPELFTLAFNTNDGHPLNLHVMHRAPAVGSHSWLHLSNCKKLLYATAWSDPPTLVAYAVKTPTEINQINSVPTASRSGYVTASSTAVYSAGGASGEVFALDPLTGGFAIPLKDETTYEPLQKLNFVEDVPQQDDGTVMDFGGLRHGAHSYWADEVRTSRSNGVEPHYLYTSTRGLVASTKGYVAAFSLTEDGLIRGWKGGDQDGLLALWETPTSGGWANAIQPGPTIDGTEYIAMTDSEEGLIMILSWDGQGFREAARTKLDPGTGAATAVWL